MTLEDEQIIRSVMNTLVELVYGIKKKETGLTKDKIKLLGEYEQALLKMLNEDLFQNGTDESEFLNN